MKYSSLHDQFLIDPSDLKRFAVNMRYAMKCIRTELGVPLGTRDQAGELKPIDFIEKGLLDACTDVSVDMGSEWGCELDLTKAGK